MSDYRGYNSRTNPRSMLVLNSKCSSVFPVLFDGLRVSVHRGLSSHFKVNHSIFFSSITPGNYRFGATYVGNKFLRKFESVPVLFGDTDVHGNMNTTLYHMFASRFKIQFSAQISNYSFVANQLEAHFYGDSFTASAVLANSNMFKQSGCLLLQYLQNVSSKWDVGVEVAFLQNLQSFKGPAGELKEIQPSLVARYKTPRSTWVAVGSLNNLLVSCYRQASDQLEFGIELNTNIRTHESVGTFGYKVRLHQKGVVFRAAVDSNTNVSSVFEKRICGSPMAFALSTNLNFRTVNFRLGLGITVE